MGKRSRKRRPDGTVAAAPKPAPVPAADPGEEPAPSKAELRNREIRANLVPLEEGERPTAVTVAALVALFLALANLVLWAVGTDVRGSTTSPVGVIIFAGLMLLAAWGMWRTKYWAVLGFQALLAVTVIIAFLSLMVAARWQAVVLCLSIIGFGGWLFWKLIRAMARIQMPTYER